MRLAGKWGSENVGMSNRKSGESPDRRKPKVSLAMTINQGLGGPKANPKGVVEGQPVNIPAHLYSFRGVRRHGIRECYWIHFSAPKRGGRLGFGRANSDKVSS